MDVILCADANGFIGSKTSSAIGSHASDAENITGRKMHEFLVAHDIWLPSTFERYAKGPNHTFTAKSGSQHRIDFV
eukprot:6256024-Alexandrium_andersonii.AAC.1